MYGPPKTGKTHWAMFETPEPVFVVDTERRGSIVQAKAVKTGRDVRRKGVSNFDGVRSAVSQAIKDSLPASRRGDPCGTIVFDSASDLLDWAVEAWLRETGNKKVYPRVAWAHVYEKVDKVLEAPRRVGMNVVLLCRAKDEWQDDEPTGRLTFEGYKKFPYRADIGILMGVGRHGWIVTLNALDREFDREPDDISWSSLFGTKEES